MKNKIYNKFLNQFINSKLSKFFLILIKKKPLGALGFLITILLLIAGLFADYLAPYGVNELHMSNRLQAPSAQFWLGTDNLGRDIFAAFKNVVGGEIEEYTKLQSDAREQALERMIADAINLNADAVINLRFSTSLIMQGASEILAYGTAVKLA